MAVLAEFSAAWDQLESDHEVGASDETIAATLGRIRIARCRCDEVAEAVLETRPRTTEEVTVRREALSAYLAKVDVDQLTRQALFEFDIAGANAGSLAARRTGFSQHVPWKTWLKLNPGPKS